MINRISPLPYWHVPHLRPAVHDLESMSVLEQTGKLYGVIQELIDDYNKMARDVNSAIEQFISGVNSDQNEFENYITKLVHDYIAMLDEKLKTQDAKIEEAYTYLKDNLQASLQNIIDEMKENGEFNEVITQSLNEISENIKMMNKWTKADGEINVSQKTLHVNVPYDTIDEFCFRILGSDDSSFGYLTIPTDLWHNNGEYIIYHHIHDRTITTRGSVGLEIKNKTETGFDVVATDMSVHVIYVYYKLKIN